MTSRKARQGRMDDTSMAAQVLEKAMRHIYDPTTPPYTPEEQRFIRSQKNRRPTVPFDYGR